MENPNCRRIGIPALTRKPALNEQMSIFLRIIGIYLTKQIPIILKAHKYLIPL